MPQTREQLEEHYAVEKALAAKLRDADASERRRLYAQVYDEFYRRVPHHPQLVRKRTAEETRQNVEKQMRLLGHFVSEDTVFLECGAGDCAVSFAVASRAKRVYALDVSEQITKGGETPKNFELILSDGCSVPLPRQSVDVVYSNQLMEHLHPEDAVEQLKNIFATLKSEGRYICVTPNPLNGPHDISRYFEDVASGFHLKEYKARELFDVFRKVGFGKIEMYAVIKGSFWRVPKVMVFGCEWFLTTLPVAVRRPVSRVPPFRFLLGAPVIAVKP